MEHLYANIEALSIRLSPEQMKDLESVESFDVGFPSNFIVSEDLFYRKTISNPLFREMERFHLDGWRILATWMHGLLPPQYLNKSNGKVCIERPQIYTISMHHRHQMR